jgi:GT2 family glycosyltransferase
MSRPLVLSVVIPTYQRPQWIRRAVLSLALQDRPPDEVIAVARDTDLPTHQAIAALQTESLPFKLQRELVSAPGFIPPVKAGVGAATGDIIAVMDDDAEAVDGWSARLLANYTDVAIGAVGGRCINTSDEKGPTPVPDTDRVGYVNGVGQFVGRMYCRPTFTTPVEVDFLMGGNMSFRRDIAKRLEFDMELNRNVAQGYEVDIGLQVRRMGLKIIFDPQVAILHYSAPRATVGLRTFDEESIQWYAFNQLRVGLRRLSLPRKSVSLIYQFAIGERPAPGIVPLMLSPLARRLGFDTRHARPALKGRLLAVRSVFLPTPPVRVPA